MAAGLGGETCYVLARGNKESPHLCLGPPRWFAFWSTDGTTNAEALESEIRTQRDVVERVRGYFVSMSLLTCSSVSEVSAFVLPKKLRKIRYLMPISETTWSMSESSSSLLARPTIVTTAER